MLAVIGHGYCPEWAKDGWGSTYVVAFSAKDERNEAVVHHNWRYEEFACVGMTSWICEVHTQRG